MRITDMVFGSVSDTSENLLSRARSLLILLRPTHWVKNAFVFAPLIFSGRLFQPRYMARSMLAFASFSMIASSVYIINDILDLEEDKKHPLKRLRPLASGKVSFPIAFVTALILASGSFVLSVLLGWSFALSLVAYFLLNIFYSKFLKHVVIIDILCIATGFLLRVIGGGLVVGVVASNWLLVCTALLSLFLAICKRRHEFTILSEEASSHRAVLRHYSHQFLDQMLAVTTASSLLSYILYTIDPKTVQTFGTNKLLLTSPFVAYGIFRYQYLVYRKNGGGSPTNELLTDTALLLDMALWIITVIFVIYSAGKL